MLPRVTDPADWAGQDLSNGTGWRFDLTSTDIDALRALAARIRPGLDEDPGALLSLSQSDFDLAAFGPTLIRVRESLQNGLGFALIRGLPVDAMDRLDCAIIYWAIGTHLGRATPNNPEGDMFGHITDLGKTQSDATTRGYQTRELMDYHCDQCDIVGLMCLRRAQRGGTSMLASSISMYNTLAQDFPDLAKSLTQPLYWSKMGEHAPHEAPYYESPVFNFKGTRLSTSFGPKHIEKGHALPGVTPLSDLQRTALRTAEEIAHAQRFEMELVPGDMQFANNYVTLHTRSAYTDHPDPARKRLLWRLWLMNPELRHRTAYSRQFERGVALGQARAQLRL